MAPALVRPRDLLPELLVDGDGGARGTGFGGGGGRGGRELRGGGDGGDPHSGLEWRGGEGCV